MKDRVLSIIIPAYNEEAFIGALLRKIQAVDLTRWGIAKEIIVVDDCSTDRTPAIARGFEEVIVTSLPHNSGKGAAVRKGLELAAGAYVIIQDADLEYDPEDYIPLLERLLSGSAEAVYGSRYMKRSRNEKGKNCLGRYPGQTWSAYLGGRALSLVALLLTGRYLTDTVTALKLFRGEVIKSLDLLSSGFELDHEITSKLLAQSRRIEEAPIHYSPRSKAEGKKIGLRDWFIAVETFLKYRNG